MRVRVSCFHVLIELTMILQATVSPLLRSLSLFALPLLCEVCQQCDLHCPDEVALAYQLTNIATINCLLYGFIEGLSAGAAYLFH